MKQITQFFLKGESVTVSLLMKLSFFNFRLSASVSVYSGLGTLISASRSDPSLDRFFLSTNDSGFSK